MRKHTILGILVGFAGLLAGCSTPHLDGGRADFGYNFYTTHFGATQSNGDHYNENNKIMALRGEFDLNGEKRHADQTGNNWVFGIHASTGENSFYNDFQTIGGDATYMVPLGETYEAGAGVRLGAVRGYTQVNNGGWFPAGGARVVFRHQRPTGWLERLGVEVNYTPGDMMLDALNIGKKTGIDDNLAVFATYTLYSW